MTAVNARLGAIPDANPLAGAIRIWLFTIAAFVFAMVVVGGATRLTGSGLSITEWRPILGAIPPLSEADWIDAFEKYKQIPQYELLNKGMSLAEFKGIYWWEWSHRLLGRSIGFVFLLPLLFFWAKGAIDRSLARWLLFLLVIGGAQGAMGWYMVKSGLSGHMDKVSQYRLAAHLALATVIMGGALWVAFGIRRGVAARLAPAIEAAFGDGTASATRAAVVSAFGLTALIFLQIVLGAFVSGLHAGLSHNTWPLMDGRFIPEGLWNASPWQVNLFENIMTVQFDHRMAAYVVAAWAWASAAWLWLSGNRAERASATALALAVLAQFALGVWTLLAVAPISLALAHQAGALIVFGLAVWRWRRLSLAAA
jgi:heme a synthase